MNTFIITNLISMIKLKVQHSKRLKLLITASFVFFLAAGSKWFFKGDNYGFLFMLLVFEVVSFYAWLNIHNEKWYSYSRGILIGLGSLLFGQLIIKTFQVAMSDREWDFMCFYMQGLLGVHNLPFYDPHSYSILIDQVNINYVFSKGFKIVQLEVGLLYPPTSMLFLAPIALFDQQTSRIFLSILVSIFILFSTYGIHHLIFAKNGSFYNLLLVFIFLMILPGTLTTIGYSQTNFFILFLLLLTLRQIDKPRAGIFLALSIIFKPITFFLIIHPLIQRRWGTILYFSITGLILLFITSSIWGFQNVVDFFISSPYGRLPKLSYVESNNQSLMALLFRNLKDIVGTQYYVYFIYFIVSTILLIVTSICSLKMAKINKTLSVFPFIPAMLIIYPGSLNHYMVYLLPVIIWFMVKKDGEKYFWLIIIPFSAFFFQVFYSYLLLWLFLIYFGFYKDHALPQEEIVISKLKSESDF